MSAITFPEFRGLVLNAFKSVELSVKIFGGVAVSIYSEYRETSDIDIAVQKDLDDVGKLIVALLVYQVRHTRNTPRPQDIRDLEILVPLLNKTDASLKPIRIFSKDGE